MGVVRGRTVRSLRRDGAEVLGVPDLESSEPVSARIQPLVPARATDATAVGPVGTDVAGDASTL